MTRHSVTFSVWLERLTRHVRLPDERVLVHECTLGVFERVVLEVDDHPEQGTTTRALRHGLADAPSAEIDVALDFLVHFGLVVRRGRSFYPCVPSLYEAALTRFAHLAEASG